ncbi:MAG: DUF4381 domain-containing protein [Pseudomonadota bacterium]
MNPDALPLRDIHLPAAVSWWPLAPGWWLLAALFVIAVLIAVVRLARPPGTVGRARIALRHEWVAWQRHRDAKAFIGGLSQTMRRTAIAVGGRQRWAAVTGSEWRAFLNASMPQQPFSEHPGSLLVDGLYRASDIALSDAQAQTLLSLCEQRLAHIEQHGRGSKT